MDKSRAKSHGGFDPRHRPRFLFIKKIQKEVKPMEEILNALNVIEWRLLAIWLVAVCILTVHIVAEVREAFLMVTALKMQRDNKEAVEISKQQR